MRSSLRAVVLFVSSLTAVVACSETSSPKAGGPANIDAGANDFDAGGPSEVVDAAPRPDADVADADGGLLQPTKKTAVAAAIGGVTRTLHRAQFGVTKDGASETLHIEAHEGGVASCPETGTPERTL
ncbi:MAG TPA: hypothetical protein VM925_04335, partial [Labilithrix sp.]|nr:hypothetical protein [Labilithrix sp.]